MATGRKDPVDGVLEERKLAEDVVGISIDNLKMEDFQTAPPEAARIVDPFAGYPLKKIKFGEFTDKKTGKKVDGETFTTFIVGLNPMFSVPNDPNNRGKIKTSHSRCIRDTTNENVDVVFDRILKVANGKLRFSIVPSHWVRSQLMFKYDDKLKRPVVDKRYVFLDMGQVSRLQRVFQMVINPKLRQERLSAAVSGESQEALETIPQTDVEETAAEE